METYLLKFSACLFVFWVVYILFLERQNMHLFKRFYLLAAFIIALVIPNLTITEYIEPVVTDFEMAPSFIPTEFVEITPVDTPSIFTLVNILWFIYGVGALLFALRFIVNLINMRRRISKNKQISTPSFIYVLLNEDLIPHSFFRYIFFNKARFESNNIPQEVLLHEETHAKQLHSIDIIVLEVLQIVFWFHPLIYILKHHVKLNHEFLADQAVLNQCSDAKVYQNILLQFSSNTQNHQLASAINYSSIKKRFTVMKTQTSKTRIWLSTLLVMPLIAILFYSFAEREYVENNKIDTVTAIEKELQEANNLNITYVGDANEKLMQEYRDFIKEYSETNTIFYSKYERAVIIYDQLMSDEQRSSVKKYPTRIIPESNLSKTQPRQPSASQYEAFKNANQYAIWIDGKHVSNTVLNQYSVNDFVHVTGSIVHKNARSIKFPQANQYDLYTKEGFKLTYKNSQLNRYNKAVTKYSNAISNYLQGNETDNSELKIIKAQADKIYKTFTKDEIERLNIRQSPPIPLSNESKNTTGIKEYITKYKMYETLRSSKPHYINKTEKQQKELDVLFSDLGGMYFRLSEENKAKVKRPISPIKPYVQVTLNGSIYYKKYKDLNEEEKATLPPPPPAPQSPTKNLSFLAYIEDMEKQGATFYLDDKKISAEKAKYIAKTNKGKSTEMLTQKDKNGKYIVKLSTPVKNKKENPLPIVNGKTIKSGEMAMTFTELKKLTLTLPEGEITAFKLKIPGIKTEQINGNKITQITLKNLESAKLGDYITIFDIKDDNSSKFSPLAIEIVE
ncbi:M56 family metallopeptidase [uncultured Winogradskyella sp.]|uniref:M56 family metallopeptidase n=1 Tax=Winogradskyella sp. 4-2091 TaxID=3381659 RepID=UPI00261E0902|nr:M56 family metallopeptidase [uncultured Winogradskyella sp.]